ncbi:MAG: DUF4302 domain-containing protein [Chitinophagaceae bacterium]
MKKLSIYIIAVAALASGCKKTFEDTINGQKADDRINAALTAIQSKLTKAPNGWILLETTTGTAFNQGVSQSGPVATFAYYVEFNDSNKVRMFSDFDTSMAAVPKTSDYRIKELTRPALIFDTYSYLHVPCDPDPRISKSPYGVGYGWGTDFEFTFSENISAASLGDTIRLTGNLNSASVTLIKATKAQHDAYFTGGLQATMLAWGNIQNYFKRVTTGATQFELTPGLGGAKSVDINWLDASNNLKSAASSVYFTAASVNLVTPVAIGTQTVSRFDNIVWDAGTATITTSINGTTPATITGSTAPLKNNVNAPKAWRDKGLNSGVYWVSNTGFHANGTDDGFGIANLSNATGTFYFYMYYPNGYSNPADRFVPIMLNGNSLAYNTYGTAPKSPPVFTADGRVVFSKLGDVGAIPPGGPVALSNALLYNAAGFYLILKEDGVTYDMVSASDAKSWIQWQWVF